MRIQESIKVAMRSLLANKLRSGLTMLGIIIGVAAVVSLMGIGRGAQRAIDAQIGSMGTNLLFVSPGAASLQGVRQAAGTAQTLTYEDALALMDPQRAPAVVAVAPELRSFGQAVYLGNNINTQIVGVTPDYEHVRNFQVQEGEFITQQELVARSSVAVLGVNVVNSLFAGENPIGQTIRINNVPFRVVGVLQPKGGGGFGNQDDVIVVPLTTMLARLQRQRSLGGGGSFGGSGGNRVSQISVQVASPAQMDEAIQQISAILRERHHIRYEDDFTIHSQQELLQTASQVTGLLTIFLGGIAGISLVVGGIGIMNIMLVSVTERTREIGIRKAVGARRRDILLQFLVEAAVISVLGGIIGNVVGAGVAALIGRIPTGGLQLRSVVTVDSILLATLFSIAVGLFFGIYPATRAAALNPIEALRYE
jgi:putative ABC transport system permease protein